MNVLLGYLLAVIAASLLTSLLVGLVADDNMKHIARFVGDLTLVLVILSPLTGLSESRFRQSIEDFSWSAETRQDGFVVDTSITDQLIIDRCRTYIIEKAKPLGAELEIEIILSKMNGISVPDQVRVTGQYSNHAYEQISQILERDFGIPKEKQQWKQNP